jgi:hypothetical protein
MDVINDKRSDANVTHNIRKKMEEKEFQGESFASNKSQKGCRMSYYEVSPLDC